MQCPKCGGFNIHVIETRDRDNNSIRRRRACLDCLCRWTTYEISKHELSSSFGAAGAVEREEQMNELQTMVSRLQKTLEAFQNDLARIGGAN